MIESNSVPMKVHWKAQDRKITDIYWGVLFAKITLISLVCCILLLTSPGASITDPVAYSEWIVSTFDQCCADSPNSSGCSEPAEPAVDDLFDLDHRALSNHDLTCDDNIWSLFGALQHAPGKHYWQFL
tara:strand:- start:129 stop:512 length:384 start_codon:yes stop_codon:yes gene_type:complete